MCYKPLQIRGFQMSEKMDDFDSDQFIRKMRGDDIERLVTYDKKYKATDLGMMIKTMLISLEILAERLKRA